EVKDSELQDNEWLNLYAEIALSSERPDMETYLPLEVKKVVVRTKEDVEPSMKLKSSNAIFYTIFKTHRGHECKAIIRQTRDGIQGHMCLEVTCMLGK
ncbi:BnaCnng57300D, partial [Brassica napus]